MDRALIDELQQGLVAYEAVAREPGVDGETQGGIEMIAATIRRLIDALERDDSDKARLESLTFSRQASDVYFKQPQSFKRLAFAVGGVKKALGGL